MPLLFLLAVWGVVVAARDRTTAALRIPLIACATMTGGVIAFSHVAQRYTSEFIPALTLGAIIGLVDIARRLQPAGVALKRVVVTAVCALAIFGIAANGAIGLVNARVSWRGDRLGDLVGVQLAVADALGTDVDDRVRFVATLPEHGEADALAVVGDCDAVYLGTGERHGTWVAVEHRDRQFRLDVADTGVRPGSTSLMWFSGYTVRRLHVQVNLAGQARLVMIGSSPDTSGHWLDVSPGESIDVSISSDSDRNRFVATASIAGGERRSVVHAPMTEWNRQFRSVPVTANVALRGSAEAAAIGLRISTDLGAVPELCDRLR
jgi:hypothetical protein